MAASQRFMPTSSHRRAVAGNLEEAPQNVEKGVKTIVMNPMPGTVE